MSILGIPSFLKSLGIGLGITALVFLTIFLCAALGAIMAIPCDEDKNDEDEDF